MEVVRLMAQRRHRTGKGAARQLRRAQRLPAVLYGHGESEAIVITPVDLSRIWRSEAGENAILELVIEGDRRVTTNAILREVQIDPVSQRPLHADLYRIVMDEPITLTVPLEFVNEPEDRFKMAKVMLAPLLREIEVECLPRDIPEVITVDLAALEIGEVMRAEALPLPPGVRLITGPEEALVTTEAIREEVVEEAAGEEVVAEEAGGGEAPSAEE
jgi:large subunit ribosomal protein L25